MSFVTLTACCTVAGVVFGTRAGFLYLAGTIVVVGLIGNLVCSGRIGDLLVSDPYLMSPQAWISQLSGYAGFAAVILVVSGALQSRLSNTLLAVSQQAEELRESEGRYRLLADNMRDVLFLQNMEFGVEYVSPSAERLFGCTTDELLRINVQDMFAPGSRERAVESFQHALALAEDGRLRCSSAGVRVPPQGRIDLLGRGDPDLRARSTKGRIVAVQGLLRDITVRKPDRSRTRGTRARAPSIREAQGHRPARRRHRPRFQQPAGADHGPRRSSREGSGRPRNPLRTTPGRSSPRPATPPTSPASCWPSPAREPTNTGPWMSTRSSTRSPRFSPTASIGGSRSSDTTKRPPPSSRVIRPSSRMSCSTSLSTPATPCRRVGKSSSRPGSTENQGELSSHVGFATAGQRRGHG